MLKNSPYPAWFMRAEQRYHYVQSLGRKVRDRKKYVIYQSDPLTPQHQAGLLAIFTERGLADLDDTLRSLTNMPQEELIEQLESAASDIQSPNLAEGTVKGVVEYAFGFSIEDEALCRYCDTLQDRITILGQPFLGTQYFRLKWVPLLGTTPAWLVVILRNSCYHNSKTGQARHQCALGQKIPGRISRANTTQSPQPDKT